MAANDGEAEEYNGHIVSPMAADMLRQAEAEEARFLALQTKNAADAQRQSDHMADGGVPETKRPL